MVEELGMLNIVLPLRKCKKLNNQLRNTGLDKRILGLIQEFEVRWNTDLDLLKSIDNNWIQINEALPDGDPNKLTASLTAEERLPYSSSCVPQHNATEGRSISINLCNFQTSGNVNQAHNNQSTSTEVVLTDGTSDKGNAKKHTGQRTSARRAELEETIAEEDCQFVTLDIRNPECEDPGSSEGFTLGAESNWTDRSVLENDGDSVHEGEGYTFTFPDSTGKMC
ncbi:uncharacterized protein LOC113214130 [Frankliniella occidentalis]|uniref:Uncharacterized protein LOC113214130 n=1 Tax=Frankliniella occidentalis TaxID=133901 RepID=A0A9C6X6C9_FRAOC|nr:uncharacterized protein LOC113214130 [Frankliniella occidentalis]